MSRKGKTNADIHQATDTYLIRVSTECQELIADIEAQLRVRDLRNGRPDVRYPAGSLVNFSLKCMLGYLRGVEYSKQIGTDKTPEGR